MNQALSPANQAELLVELDLGSARGGQAGINKAPLVVEVVRPLTGDDLPAITNPPPVAAQAVGIKAIRNSHHKLAQLLAEGKSGAEISLVTGYSQSYLSTIQGDPAFEELVSYYSSQRESIFVDAQERLRALGIDATERLQDHLNDPTKQWSHRELMEVIKLALPVETGSKATPPVQGAPAGGSNTLEIKFVGARNSGGPVLEAQFTEVLESGK